MDISVTVSGDMMYAIQYRYATAPDTIYKVAGTDGGWPLRFFFFGGGGGVGGRSVWGTAHLRTSWWAVLAISTAAVLRPRISTLFSAFRCCAECVPVLFHDTNKRVLLTESVSSETVMCFRGDTTGRGGDDLNTGICHKMQTVLTELSF